MLHYVGVVGYAVLGGFGGARNGGRCWLSGRRVGSIGMLRNLLWRNLGGVLGREVVLGFVCGFERVVQRLGNVGEMRAE